MRRIFALVAILAYGILSALSIAGGIHHHEWLIIGLQLILLVPGLTYALRSDASTVPTPMDTERTPAFTAMRFPPSCSSHYYRSTAVVAVVFFVVAMVLSKRVSEGAMTPDDSSYRFQAWILGTGRLVADAPPGSPATPGSTPKPLHYNHHILSRSGWFSKYPLGWPAVLALPEKWQVGWMTAPVLGLLLLMVLAMVAREVFGRRAIFPAVWMAVLSPYFLTNCVGLLSHALSATLLAAASLFYLRGIRRDSLTDIIILFLFLTFSFHVRPFSSFLFAIVLGLSLLLTYRKKLSSLICVAAISASAGAFAVISVLYYNWAYTGSALVSPYAYSRGLSIPVEISAGPSMILHNLTSTWRFSTQSTLVYSFPLIFPLAVYGFWSNRNSSAVRFLAVLFPAVFLGHLAQVEPSNSTIGERYWFDSYFAVVVLAAGGTLALLDGFRTPKSHVIAVIGLVSIVQAAMMVVTIPKLANQAWSKREVRRTAEQYRDRHCVVFLRDSAPEFYGAHLNLNRPDWKHASAIYLVDPGPNDRAAWATLLERREWVVVTYNPKAGRATAESYDLD